MRKQSTIFLSFVLVALGLSTACYAYDFRSGDLYYNITSRIEPYTVEVANPTFEFGAIPPIESTSYPFTTIDIPQTVSDNGITYTVTGIGWDAFYQCTELTSVTIPNTVKTIDRYAFCSCPKLTSLRIPDSVESMDDYAIMGNMGLTSLVVEAGNNTYDSRDNCNAIIETASNTLKFACINTVIPNTVTVIGRAFQGLPITSITIPDNITTIQWAAFNGCRELQSVTLGKGLTSIEGYAFQLCEKLESVISYAIIPPVCGQSAFAYVPKDKTTILYVHRDALEAYKADEYWKLFVNIRAIEDIPSAIANPNTESDNASMQKIVRNGQVLILRNGKTYTTTGIEIR